MAKTFTVPQDQCRHPRERREFGICADCGHDVQSEEQGKPPLGDLLLAAIEEQKRRTN